MKTLFTVLLFSQLAFGQVVTCESVPGPGRDDAAAFRIANFGYVLSGNLENGFGESNRLYRYDLQSGNWSESIAFPGIPRQYAVAFVIHEKAYFGLGISEAGTDLKDFWSFDAASQSWQQLNDFPGAARHSVFCETDGTRGFVGTGANGGTLLADCWKYDPFADQWTRIADFPTGARRETVAFTVFGHVHAGLGFDQPNGTGLKSDFYSYDPASNKWSHIEDFPGGERAYAEGVSGNLKGYVGTGYDPSGTWHSDLYAYDPSAHAWEAVDSLPISGVRGMSAFPGDEAVYFLTGTVSGQGRSSGVWKVASQSSEVGFNIFPNPSAGAVYITTAAATIEIYDLMGSLIRQLKTSSSYSVVEGLSPGIYLARERNPVAGKGGQVKRFVVF